jgi:hypothetical protein
MGGACSKHRSDEECVHNFGLKTCRKKPLRRPRRRWKDNIKIALKEIWWEGVDWIHMAQDKDRWRYLLGFIKGGEFLDYLSDY